MSGIASRALLSRLTSAALVYKDYEASVIQLDCSQPFILKLVDMTLEKLDTDQVSGKRPGTSRLKLSVSLDRTRRKSDTYTRTITS